MTWVITTKKDNRVLTFCSFYYQNLAKGWVKVDPITIRDKIMFVYLHAAVLFHGRSPPLCPHAKLLIFRQNCSQSTFWLLTAMAWQCFWHRQREPHFMWGFYRPFPKCESAVDRWRFKRQRNDVGTSRAVAGDHDAAEGAVEQHGRESEGAVWSQGRSRRQPLSSRGTRIIASTLLDKSWFRSVIELVSDSVKRVIWCHCCCAEKSTLWIMIFCCLNYVILVFEWILSGSKITCLIDSSMYGMAILILN